MCLLRLLLLWRRLRLLLGRLLRLVQLLPDVLLMRLLLQ